MKITKSQLRKIIKEAFPVKGKAVGNFIKKGRAGRKLTMQGREYIDLGKGHWQGPDGEKLNWVQLSSMASALGDEMVTIDNSPRISETKITKRELRRIIKEEMGRDFGSGDQEGRMARSQLFKVAQYAQSLHDTLQDADELPEWVMAKIAIIANDIGKVKHHLEYKMARMEKDVPEESFQPDQLVSLEMPQLDYEIDDEDY